MKFTTAYMGWQIELPDEQPDLDWVWDCALPENHPFIIHTKDLGFEVTKHPYYDQYPLEEPQYWHTIKLPKEKYQEVYERLKRGYQTK